MADIVDLRQLFERWERVWHEGRLDFVPLCVAPQYLRHDEMGDRLVTREAYAEELSAFFGRDLADPAAIAMKQLSAAAKYDASARLGTLEVPTLVMSATHDRIALPEFGRELVRLVPRARYLERDAAHGLPITRAKEVNDLLAEHFHSASAR